MQIGGFLQQLVLEVLSVLPVKQELQVRQVQSVLRVLDLYLCSGSTRGQAPETADKENKEQIKVW